MSTGTTVRVAWFHCFSGVAGDMALGALIDAGADVDDIRRIVDGLDIDGWSLGHEPVIRQGLAATRAIVGAPEDHEHHRPYRHIRERLERAALPSQVRDRALAAFAALAAAEGALHDMPVDDVEFHEVGALDAIVDVVGVCAALEVLGIQRVVCSPISVGRGTIKAAHGQLPNPAPAVTAMAAHFGLPLVGLDEPSELATPTGVALMATLADSFGPMPSGAVVATGLGAGGRNPSHRPNVVQVVVVDVPVASHDPAAEPLVELATNVDDVTGEVLAYTVARLMDGGALDAWVVPIVMKKGRPAHTVHVLCRPLDVGALRDILQNETGTLGVRATAVERWAADRDVVTVDIDGHQVRVKRSPFRAKAEYDDAVVAARALGLPLRDVQARAEALAAEE
jgi:hypothetical protein